MTPDAKRTSSRPHKVLERASNRKAPSGGARRRSRDSRRRSFRRTLASWVTNPHLAFLLVLSVGLATRRVEHQWRLAFLWLSLLLVVLLYAESGRLRATFSLANLARGALVGTVLSLPVFLLARSFLLATALRLYGTEHLTVLIERAVFLVPVLEESFFRGVAQRERGHWDAAVLYGLMQALYFLSAADVYPAVVVAVAAGSMIVGLLYSYVYQMFGLTASIGCHVAVSFVLLALPALLQGLQALLAF